MHASAEPRRYFLSDQEEDLSLKMGDSDGLIAYSPEALSPQNWTRVAQFMDQNIFLPAGGGENRCLDPDNPNLLSFLGRLWNTGTRSAVQLLLCPGDRHIDGTAVMSLVSSDPFHKDARNPVREFAGDDYVSHWGVGIYPGLQRAGGFSLFLYPCLSQMAQMVADQRGEVVEVLNLAPDSPEFHEAMWRKRGFQPMPGEVQRKLDQLADERYTPALRYFYKKTQGHPLSAASGAG